MQIGIISDTHNYLMGINEALDFFLENQIYTIFHCGDWTKPETVKHFAVEAHKRGQKVYGVFGNNDREYIDEITKLNSVLFNPVNFPKNSEYLLFKHKKIRMCIYHGDSKQTIEKILNEENLDVLFLGHSHIPKKEFYKQTQILNPGSIAYSIPFRKRDLEIRTVGIYDTQKRNFTLYEI